MSDTRCECCGNYEELLKKYQAAETEKNKLARELRALLKREEINLMNADTQAALNRMISDEKQKQEAYIRLLLESSSSIIFAFDENAKFLLGSKSMSRIIDVDDVSVLKGREFENFIERYSRGAEVRG